MNKIVGLANDSEGDGFWMAIKEAINWMHLVTAKPDPMLGAPNIFKVALHWEEEVEIQLGEEEWITAVIIPIEDDNLVCVKLYDLGATQHITPY
jgi:hypothetical protein